MAMLFYSKLIDTVNRYRNKPAPHKISWKGNKPNPLHIRITRRGDMNYKPAGAAHEPHQN
jgi:hypothetical protein